MTLVTLDPRRHDPALLKPARGLVVVCAGGAPDRAARAVDRLTRGALGRALASPAWTKLKPGEGMKLAFPSGMDAEAVLVLNLPARSGAEVLRRAGALVARSLGESGALLALPGLRDPAPLVEGMLLRAYRFSRRAEAPEGFGPVVLALRDPEAARPALEAAIARAEGVHLARDLANEPANILTTTAFAERALDLRALGVEVEVLDEPALEKLGMRALLAVGQGSESPSRVAVMRWPGAEGAPLALIGKGVVFDSGGISIKPAAGMEEMIMDMAGAAAVVGAMHALARRKAPAHVVGLIGLVENMPDGRAQRPGDVVASMKGDTIEVINTDAEGRMVLADLLWYAQQRFQPAAMINLATLTGAVIVALGHDRAGLFANDDTLASRIATAAADTGEGVWRLPLGPAYDKLIKSRVADMKNSGGRHAGAITAAQFLARFVRPDTPWAHLDIAGTAMPVAEGELAPKGASGFGVRLLDRLVAAHFGG